MGKLTIKDLAPYLPYGLKIYEPVQELELVMDLATTYDTKNIGLPFLFFGGSYRVEYGLPILRPLYDLTKEDFKEELYQYYQTLGIDVKLVNYDSGNDNPFDITLSVTYKLMGDVFTDALINRGSTSESPYHFIKWLCENHFDINNLIKQGLAIDINTLK